MVRVLRGLGSRPVVASRPQVLAGGGNGNSLKRSCSPLVGSFDRPCDAMCAREARACATGKRRVVALILRGDAFRNWGHQGNMHTCCAGTEDAQRDVAEAHRRLLIEPMERAGYDVRVYVSTYHCTNGRDLATTLLPTLYGRWLRGLVLRNRTAASQWGTFSRAIALAASDASPGDGRNGKPLSLPATDCVVDHALVLRLDMRITKFNLCLLEADRAINRHALDTGGGSDQFLYVPGRLFPCVAKYRTAQAAYSQRGAARGVIPSRSTATAPPRQVGRPRLPGQDQRVRRHQRQGVVVSPGRHRARRQGGPRQGGDRMPRVPHGLDGQVDCGEQGAKEQNEQKLEQNPRARSVLQGPRRFLLQLNLKFDPARGPLPDLHIPPASHDLDVLRGPAPLHGDDGFENFVVAWLSLLLASLLLALLGDHLAVAADTV